MLHKTALVVGATGVVGRELVRQLCENPAYGKVIVWLRRTLPWTHAKLDTRLVDFQKIAMMPPEPVDEIYCALGTTIKQAGSRAQFLQVDVQYPAAVGQWGRGAGVPRFLLVSAPGADTRSRLFYLRAKGQAEQTLKDCGYQTLDIFHPPLIAGERVDRRLAERFAIALFRCLPHNWLASYRPMTGAQIAERMIAVAQHQTHGVQLHRLRANP